MEGHVRERKGTEKRRSVSSFSFSLISFFTVLFKRGLRTSSLLADGRDASEQISSPLVRDARGKERGERWLRRFCDRRRLDRMYCRTYILFSSRCPSSLSDYKSPLLCTLGHGERRDARGKEVRRCTQGKEERDEG